MRLQVPTFFFLKSRLSKVWLECGSLVHSGEKYCGYTQLWHLFTFGWYLWRDLHLVVFAPLLPVPPLFFRQGRRHTDQTGDRLAGAGLKTDGGGMLVGREEGGRTKQPSNAARKLTCSEGFWPSGNYLWRYDILRNIMSANLGGWRQKIIVVEDWSSGGINPFIGWMTGNLLANLLAGASSVCTGRWQSPWTCTCRADPRSIWAQHTSTHLKHTRRNNILVSPFYSELPSSPHFDFWQG